MKVNQKIVLGILIVFLSSFSLHAQEGSIAAIRSKSATKMEKANGNIQNYLARTSQIQSAEQVQQGKFTIVLNPLANGQWETQVSRTVAFGTKRVNSIFASLYQSGIEYTYSFHSGTNQIRQYHYICPPNSLTCWSNPSDYAILTQFDWGENFPSRNCALSVFTSEEYGREYLQASCFPNRDAALQFATKFVSYTKRNRM